ncbi:MAG TPA: HAMP domain-containing sensor histidine kinase, partial [Flavisolibacter sp.]
KKNLSPRQLSAFTAFILSVPVSLGIFLLNNSLQHAFIAFVLMLAGSFLLVNSIFQHFIYRKIKLIYKFIYQTKASKKEEMYHKYLLPKKGIDDVRDDVEAWATQQTREMELLKKNETFRKEFLQNLSHEFKTPVFALQGYLEILSQGGSGDPDTNQRFLEKAAKNVDRLVNLLRDLDEISKLERGELKLHPQYFVIHDLVREAFESLSYKAEQKHISLSFKKGCEQPVVVHADKEKIRQVLLNLIDNAIRYGRDGGMIEASVYNMDDRNILVEISDDGMGIPEKHLERIFERFFRTNEGRARDATGTGLGLAICKHIIEAHGHSIHVRSKENVGTSIGFTLSAGKRAYRDQ